jgi:hypothetical protein
MLDSDFEERGRVHIDSFDIKRRIEELRIKVQMFSDKFKRQPAATPEAVPDVPTIEEIIRHCEEYPYKDVCSESVLMIGSAWRQALQDQRKTESASKDIKAICGAAMNFFLLTMTTVQAGVLKLKAENEELKQVIQQMGQSK